MDDHTDDDINHLERGIKEVKQTLEATKAENLNVKGSVMDLEHRSQTVKRDFLKQVEQKSDENVYLEKIKQLEDELETQIAARAELEAKNDELKRNLVKMQLNTEMEEEYISNSLLKRIEKLKSEKQALLVQLEEEEEMITNTLTRKLNKLQKEKVEMEIALENEQELIVNRLQKQLDEMRVGTSRQARRLEHSGSPSA